MEPDRDIVVVGGGIHGVGVAQAAGAAGLSALLLEKDELAHGTSSRSSKLIHGGLRYLETFRLGLVREGLTEREILLRVAPDLVRRVAFHVPLYDDSRRRPWQVRAGLAIYALLGGLGRTNRFRSVSRGDWAELDGLRTEGLRAVFRYHDGQTDDAALTRAVARSAESLGAVVELRAGFVGAEREDEGYRVAYRLDGREHEVRCRCLVNAAGPWASSVLERIRPRVPGPEVELVQGAHLVLPDTVERGAYYTEAPRDGRPVFVMPWKGRTLVGTTETPYRGDPDAVAPLPGERDYLLETFARHFPGRDTTVADAFAGLRVLPRRAGSPHGRPRSLMLHTDGTSPPRLVTLLGGKLTGYRISALRVLRVLRRALPRRTPVADTAELHLVPAEDAPEPSATPTQHASAGR